MDMELSTGPSQSHSFILPCGIHLQCIVSGFAMGSHFQSWLCAYGVFFSFVFSNVPVHRTKKHLLRKILLLYKFVYKGELF